MEETDRLRGALQTIANEGRCIFKHKRKFEFSEWIWADELGLLSESEIDLARQIAALCKKGAAIQERISNEEKRGDEIFQKKVEVFKKSPYLTVVLEIASEVEKLDAKIQKVKREAISNYSLSIWDNFIPYSWYRLKDSVNQGHQRRKMATEDRKIKKLQRKKEQLRRKIEKRAKSLKKETGLSRIIDQWSRDWANPPIRNAFHRDLSGFWHGIFFHHIPSEDLIEAEKRQTTKGEAIKKEFQSCAAEVHEIMKEVKLVHLRDRLVEENAERTPLTNRMGIVEFATKHPEMQIAFWW
jgi:hypothetical protein